MFCTQCFLADAHVLHFNGSLTRSLGKSRLHQATRKWSHALNKTHLQCKAEEKNIWMYKWDGGGGIQQGALMPLPFQQSAPPQLECVMHGALFSSGGRTPLWGGRMGAHLLEVSGAIGHKPGLCVNSTTLLVLQSLMNKGWRGPHSQWIQRGPRCS